MRHRKYSIASMLAEMARDAIVAFARWLWRLPLFLKIMVGGLVLVWIYSVNLQQPAASSPAVHLSESATPASMIPQPTTVRPDPGLALVPTAPPYYLDQKPFIKAISANGMAELTIYRIPEGGYWWRFAAKDAPAGCRRSSQYGCNSFLTISRAFVSQSMPFTLELLAQEPFVTSTSSKVLSYLPKKGDTISAQLVEGYSDNIIQMVERLTDKTYFLVVQ